MVAIHEDDGHREEEVCWEGCQELGQRLNLGSPPGIEPDDNTQRHPDQAGEDQEDHDSRQGYQPKEKDLEYFRWIDPAADETDHQPRTYRYPAAQSAVPHKPLQFCQQWGSFSKSNRTARQS